MELKNENTKAIPSTTQPLYSSEEFNKEWDLLQENLISQIDQRKQEQGIQGIQNSVKYFIS